MRRLGRLRNEHSKVVGIVAVTVAVVAAFFLGQWFGNNRSGTAAEWAAGVGAFAAVVVALWLANKSTRDEQRGRDLDLALRFLMVVERDAHDAVGAQGEVRSTEGVALAHVLRRRVGLGQIAADYYTDPQNLVAMARARGGTLRTLTDLKLWEHIRRDALDVIERLSR